MYIKESFYLNITYLAILVPMLHAHCLFDFSIQYIGHEKNLLRCLGHRGCSANPVRSREIQQVEKKKMRIIRNLHR